MLTKPLIRQMMFSSTLQGLVSDNFYLWERKLVEFVIVRAISRQRSIRVVKTRKTAGKSDAGSHKLERRVKYVLEKSELLFFLCRARQ